MLRRIGTRGVVLDTLGYGGTTATGTSRRGPDYGVGKDWGKGLYEK